MTAAHLRTAAAALREVAGVARPGPWRSVEGAMGTTLRAVESGDGRTVCDYTEDEEADYIATMSPPVALAVAAWLDREADEHERYVEGAVRVKGIRTAYANERAQHALAVADAVLGDREMAAP